MQTRYVLLHNIRSTHNVGSIFRTADCSGIQKIFLSGYTPAPTDRFGRSQREIAKVALGAEKSVAWEQTKSPMTVIRRLKQDGWTIVGVEQDEHSIHYKKLRMRDKILFIFGNEVRGLSKGVRDLCDVIIEIPMHGRKESLNVSVAAGIILFGTI